MPNTQLHDLARMGAGFRLAVLDQERDEILKMFPELRDGARQNGSQPQRRTTRSRSMSAAERKAVSERMRAYWAERRAKKAAGAKRSSAKKSASAAKRKRGMSAQARKAQGERMKAYWAARRAKKQAVTSEGVQADAGSSTNGAPASAGRRSRPKQGRKK